MSPDITTMLYIFFARICDVSIGTIRIILIARGKKYIAPILGFVEILIWLTAISKVLNTMSGVGSYLIYAAGFASGNYVGMLIEELLSFGHVALRVVTRIPATDIIDVLRGKGFGVTTFAGQGLDGDVSLLYTVVPRKKIKEVMGIIETYHPRAFITVEDVRSYKSGYISARKFPQLFGRSVSKKE